MINITSVAEDIPEAETLLVEREKRIEAHARKIIQTIVDKIKISRNLEAWYDLGSESCSDQRDLIKIITAAFVSKGYKVFIGEPSSIRYLYVEVIIPCIDFSD